MEPRQKVRVRITLRRRDQAGGDGVHDADTRRLAAE